MRAVIGTGTPVVLVLVSGRPCRRVSGCTSTARAVIEAWFPGEEGAVAVAEVLGGEVNPGGKLPISFPRSRRARSRSSTLTRSRVAALNRTGDYVDLSGRRRSVPVRLTGLSYTTLRALRCDASGSRRSSTDGEIIVDRASSPNTVWPAGRRNRAALCVRDTAREQSLGRYSSSRAFVADRRFSPAGVERRSRSRSPRPDALGFYDRGTAPVRRRAGCDRGVRRHARPTTSSRRAGVEAVDRGPAGAAAREGVRRSRSRSPEDEGLSSVADHGQPAGGRRASARPRDEGLRGRRPGRRHHRPRDRRRRVHGARRPVRLRQVHPPAADRRPGSSCRAAGRS